MENRINPSDAFSRTTLLVGEEGINKLASASVLVCGLGGVGGYALEAIARAGVGRIGVLDDDLIHESNLNRQLLATTLTVGRKKTEVAKERILSINPNCKVDVYDLFYLPETADEVPIADYDVVVDAIDTVTAKIELIVRANAQNVTIVSSMGTGNKLNTRFEQTDLFKTSVCPLAKVMRKELKARGINHLPVVYSTEEQKTSTLTENGRHIPASISYVPPISGLMLAEFAIKKILE